MKTKSWVEETAMADVVIQMVKNGPLLVNGAVRVANAEGQPIPIQPGQRVALCRCGQSGKKPFCDGSHKTAGFQG